MWLEKLQRNKECACANDWKRTYILHFLSFLFVWNIGLGSYMIYSQYKNQCSVQMSTYISPATRIVQILLGIGLITYLILGFLYAKMLKQRACSCAMKDLGYNVLRVHVFLIGALLVFPIIIPILVLLIALASWGIQSMKK